MRFLLDLLGHLRSQPGFLFALADKLDLLFDGGEVEGCDWAMRVAGNF